MDTFQGFQSFPGGPMLNNADTGRFYTAELSRDITIARAALPGGGCGYGYYLYLV